MSAVLLILLIIEDACFLDFMQSKLCTTLLGATTCSLNLQYFIGLCLSPFFGSNCVVASKGHIKFIRDDNWCTEFCKHRNLMNRCIGHLRIDLHGWNLHRINDVCENKTMYTHDFATDYRPTMCDSGPICKGKTAYKYAVFRSANIAQTVRSFDKLMKSHARMAILKQFGTINC